MDQAAIDDLKDFIATIISQRSADMATKEDITQLIQKIDGVDKKLTTRIDNLQEYIADALDISNESTEVQLQDHEQRLTKLEAKPV